MGPLENHLNIRIVTSGLLILALGFLVLLWSTWTLQETRQTAISELQLATERGAGQISYALRALELVMRTASVHVEATGTKEGLQPYLQQLTDRLPPIRTVTIISPDGLIRTDLRPGEPAKGYQVSDRAYFQAHLPPDAVSDYFYSPPLESRLDGMTQITLSLAARRSNDDLIAVVVSSIDDRFFAALSQELQTLGLYDARVLYKDGRNVYTLHERTPADAEHDVFVDALARLLMDSETVHREQISIPFSDLSFQLSLPAAGYIAQAAPLVLRGSLIITLIVSLLAMVLWLAHRGRAQIEDSEKRFKAFAEAASDWFWEMDENLRFSKLSDRFTEITGVPTEDIIGKTRQETGIPNIEPEEWLAHLTDLETHQPIVEFIHTRIRPDGKTVWLSINGLPIFNDSGQFKGYRGTGKDITKRKRTEDALRESEHSLNNAQRIAKMGNWELDVATNEIHWSDEIYRIFEIDPETFSGKFEDFYARVHPDDRGVFDQFDRAVAVKERAYSREYRIVLPHGGSKIIQTHAEITYDDNGKAIRVSGTDQDLTELRNAEEITKMSEERFRSSFENVPVGNMIIDDTGLIEVFNRAAEKIFGYDRDEIIGQNIEILMPEPYHSQHDSYLHNYLETGEAKIIGIGREVVGLRKNGEEFPMHLSVGEMRMGDRRSFIGSVTDLSEIQALEQRLIHAQRMEAVGQLTGGIAHDFNNLLAVMIGNATLLGDVVDGNEEANYSIDAIKAAVERGASLTNRLLAFSRQSALSPKPTDINDLMLGLEDMLQRTLGETVELLMVPGPEACIALIDAHQFEDALVNLALNARDAMPQGGTLTIQTVIVTLDGAYAKQHEEVMPGDYVKISVSDTGTGIPPEALVKVFEPFFTTKEVGKGSGLGLSMVFGFAKQSNGHITIRTKVSHGTTIKLYLPRSEEEGTKETPKAGAQEPARGSARILVVEDDAFVREIPVRLLRKQGYEVVEAEDGMEAIKHLQGDQHFDVLFTDVILPGGMNGVEIAEEAIRIQPGIKTVFTSGYADNSVVNEKLQELGVTLLSKPYLPEKLLEKVREALDSDGA